MSTSGKTTGGIETKVLLSTLWIMVMINMLKEGILSLYIPGSAEELARTSASAGASIPQLMLIGAIMGQLGIAMIILSRVLKYRINRWVNIVVGIVTIAYIWGRHVVISSLHLHRHGRDSLSAADCLVCWKWRNPEV